jgi:Tetratricopeptide repeat
LHLPPTHFSVRFVQAKEYAEALSMLQKNYDFQKRRIMKNNNRYLIGITAHNLGVVCVLAGRDHNAVDLFNEALELKRDAFGEEHPEVAVSTSMYSLCTRHGNVLFGNICC